VADEQPGVVVADGKATVSREVDGGTVRFKVVRLPPEKMPEGRIQYVQQLTPEHIWRASDVNRLRLEEVFVVAKNPVETAARWARFAAVIPRTARDGVQLETSRGRIFIGKRAVIAQRLGAAPAAPAIAGYALACRHPEKLAVRCKAAGIKVQKHGKRYSAMRINCDKSTTRAGSIPRRIPLGCFLDAQVVQGHMFCPHGRARKWPTLNAIC